VAFKLRLYREYIKERGKVDILLFGNSVVQAVNVAWYEENNPGESIAIFNGGIGGLIPETAHFVLKNGFLKEGTPKNIVYVVGARDLRDKNGMGRLPYKRPFFQSIAARDVLAVNFIDKLVVFFEKNLYLFGARKAIRNWIINGDVQKSETIQADSNGVSTVSKGRIKVEMYPPDFYYRTRYNQYGINRKSGQYSWMLRFAEECRNNQINLIFAISPVAPACLSLFDNPDKDYALFRSVMQEISDKTEVPLIDVHADLRLENQHFSNADHVNQDGAMELSKYFSERVFSFILEDQLSVLH
jgi:hypothetical protein